MSRIKLTDLQAHEVLGSDVLSDIHGGIKSAEYPLSRGLFIYPEPLSSTVTQAEWIGLQQAEIGNSGAL